MAMKGKGIVIAVTVVLLLGMGYFFISKKGTTQTPETETQTETSTGTKSLRDLLSANIAQKCTYTITNESDQNEGVTYVANGKVRADFSVAENGKTTQTHMISDGKTSWIWTDGETTGFKMTVEKTEPQSGTESAPETSFQAGVNWDEKLDYKCSAWITDGSFFTPPVNVNFTDFSELLNKNR